MIPKDVFVKIFAKPPPFLFNGDESAVPFHIASRIHNISVIHTCCCKTTFKVSGIKFVVIVQPSNPLSGDPCNGTVPRGGRTMMFSV